MQVSRHGLNVGGTKVTSILNLIRSGEGRILLVAYNSLTTPFSRQVGREAMAREISASGTTEQG